MTMYGYARVSAAGQDHAGQVEELTAAGCVRVFAEQASAAAGRKRPQLARALAALEPGDVLAVTRLSRLARSARDALNMLATVTARGAGFRSLREAWADTTTPAGRLAVTLMCGLAEFDREMILERTSEGRAAARARGVIMGRRPALSRGQVQWVIEARAQTPPLPIGQLVAILGVSPNTVRRAIRDAEARLARAEPGRQLDIEAAIRAGPGGPSR